MSTATHSHNILQQKTWRRFFFASAILLMTGCNQRFQPDETTEILITPLTVQVEGLNQAQFNAFLANNRTLLLTEPVTLTWTGSTKAKNRALQFSKQLRTLGADPANLTLREAPEGMPGVTVRYVTHRAQMPECQPYGMINQFDTYHQPRQQGCYVDGNRWQSLVHPERAVGRSTTVNRQP